MNRLLNAYFSHFLKNGLQICSQKGGEGWVRALARLLNLRQNDLTVYV